MGHDNKPIDEEPRTNRSTRRCDYTGSITKSFRRVLSNRQVSTDKNDLKKGGVWTSEGNHHFVFDRFYNQFLIRKRWDVPYSRTAQMLKETCNCDDKRIGKERISVFVVKQFDKKEDDYNQKELKPKDIF